MEEISLTGNEKAYGLEKFLEKTAKREDNRHSLWISVQDAVRHATISPSFIKVTASAIDYLIKNKKIKSKLSTPSGSKSKIRKIAPSSVLRIIQLQKKAAERDWISLEKICENIGSETAAQIRSSMPENYVLNFFDMETYVCPLQWQWQRKKIEQNGVTLLDIGMQLGYQNPEAFAEYVRGMFRKKKDLPSDRVLAFERAMKLTARAYGLSEKRYINKKGEEVYSRLLDKAIEDITARRDRLKSAGMTLEQVSNNLGISKEEIMQDYSDGKIKGDEIAPEKVIYFSFDEIKRAYGIRKNTQQNKMVFSTGTRYGKSDIGSTVYHDGFGDTGRIVSVEPETLCTLIGIAFEKKGYTTLACGLVSRRPAEDGESEKKVKGEKDEDEDDVEVDKKTQKQIEKDVALYGKMLGI